jgi:hypothetical protein
VAVGIRLELLADRRDTIDLTESVGAEGYAETRLLIAHAPKRLSLCHRAAS